MLLASLKSEFQFANFCFGWTTDDDFVKCKWKWLSEGKYVIFRWTLALYCTVAMILSIISHSEGKWIFALTSLNYIIVTVYFLYSAFMASWDLASSPSRQLTFQGEYDVSTKRMSRIALKSTSSSTVPYQAMLQHKIHWFLSNLAITVCTFVFVAFWTMLAPNRKGGYGLSLYTYLVIDRHGINFGLIIIDFLLTRLPFRFLHFVYSSAFIGLYFAYNYTYWSMTGNLIYGETLDYGSRPGKVVGLALGGMFIAMPLTQFLWFCAYYFKQLRPKAKTDSNANVELGV